MDERLSKTIEDITNIRNTRGVAMKGGKTYTMVADRVEAMRRNFGTDLGIETEIITLNQDLPTGDNVVVKATIFQMVEREGWSEKMVLATGHAAEVWGSSYINKTSALEAGETSAIGRALAALGIHGGEFASANELDAVVRKEEVAKKPQKTPAPVGTIMGDGVDFAEFTEKSVKFAKDNVREKCVEYWADNIHTIEAIRDLDPKQYEEILAAFKSPAQ
jgi:hypothetical protein